ncbi:hypothetical protein A1Q2_01111 [Trichosporon asahii var. asahii CBS 8904]|uniref:Protein SYM1 n=1 Tax=Trichosporon asahii var. asahii (strain CBS 8904) TaxID=1220162 RepID=K1WUH9_TRIAC|nr:hypothetical protein A1Q2_01111 [Trichosporon asahii var. asahii CBS 8904]
MATFLQKYTNFLTQKPLLGNSVTGAQVVEKKGWKNYDWKRTGRIVLWGAGIFSPAVTVWFRYLDRLPGRGTIPGTALRVACDQLIASPTVLTGFFTFMTLAEGKSLDDAKAKWKREFWPTLKTNWILWVPFQAFNQGIVPLQYRLLASNLVNIPWNTFLSYVNNRAQSQDIEMGQVKTQ